MANGGGGSILQNPVPSWSRLIFSVWFTDGSFSFIKAAVLKVRISVNDQFTGQ